MQAVSVSTDTQVVLLLCGHFSPKESASPLELREYNRLADWMRAHRMVLSSLVAVDPPAIDWTEIGLDRDRVSRLLQRGAAFALAVEKWTRSGLWILSRADDAYPRRLRAHLGRSAPALLFGVGDSAALERGGLSIVGSRDIDSEGSAYTANVARQCARENIPVVSGGARGVDEIALSAVFDAGGHAVAVLAEGLGRASLAAKYREGIREERLVLVSPYAPHAGFSVGNAMGRNKLIYALGDAALVVDASLRTGGTWAGAEEELKRERARPLFVRLTETRVKGNEALLRLGARAFPNPPSDSDIRYAIQRAVSRNTTMTIADAPASSAALVEADQEAAAPAKTAYDLVLPLLLGLLSVPMAAVELAEAFDVQSAQMKRWLDRALKEGKVLKSGRPPKFSRATDGAKQPSLFGN
jgi:predicted Rossmann fold nucleotide-binding protein DprA/Smf involved in DNA uptake